MTPIVFARTQKHTGHHHNCDDYRYDNDGDNHDGDGYFARTQKPQNLHNDHCDDDDDCFYR